MRTTSIIQTRRGMTLVEMSLYALVASILLACILFFFWRTWRMQQQQTLEMTYQGSFTNLCERLERDLTGCREWKVQGTVGTGSSLFIERNDGQITYDVRFDTGEIVRSTGRNVFAFPFRGERQGVLKTLEFSAASQRRDAMHLRIELKTTPPIELSHDFSIRFSVHKSAGYFEEPQLGTP